MLSADTLNQMKEKKEQATGISTASIQGELNKFRATKEKAEFLKMTPFMRLAKVMLLEQGFTKKSYKKNPDKYTEMLTTILNDEIPQGFSSLLGKIPSDSLKVETFSANEAPYKKEDKLQTVAPNMLVSLISEEKQPIEPSAEQKEEKHYIESPEFLDPDGSISLEYFLSQALACHSLTQIKLKVYFKHIDGQIRPFIVYQANSGDEKSKEEIREKERQVVNLISETLLKYYPKVDVFGLWHQPVWDLDEDGKPKGSNKFRSILDNEITGKLVELAVPGQLTLKDRGIYDNTFLGANGPFCPQYEKDGLDFTAACLCAWTVVKRALNDKISNSSLLEKFEEPTSDEIFNYVEDDTFLQPDCPVELKTELGNYLLTAGTDRSGDKAYKDQRYGTWPILKAGIAVTTDLYIHAANQFLELKNTEIFDKLNPDDKAKLETLFERMTDSNGQLNPLTPASFSNFTDAEKERQLAIALRNVIDIQVYKDKNDPLAKAWFTALDNWVKGPHLSRLQKLVQEASQGDTGTIPGIAALRLTAETFRDISARFKNGKLDSLKNIWTSFGLEISNGYMRTNNQKLTNKEIRKGQLFYLAQKAIEGKAASKKNQPYVTITTDGGDLSISQEEKVTENAQPSKELKKMTKNLTLFIEVCDSIKQKNKFRKPNTINPSAKSPQAPQDPEAPPMQDSELNTAQVENTPKQQDTTEASPVAPPLFGSDFSKNEPFVGLDLEGQNQNHSNSPFLSNPLDMSQGVIEDKSAPLSDNSKVGTPIPLRKPAGQGIKSPFDQVIDLKNEMKQSTKYSLPYEQKILLQAHSTLYSIFCEQAQEILLAQGGPVARISEQLLKIHRHYISCTDHDFIKDAEKRMDAINAIVTECQPLKTRSCGQKILAGLVLFVGALLFAGSIALLFTTTDTFAFGFFGVKLTQYSEYLSTAAKIVGTIGAIIIPPLTSGAYDAGFFCSKSKAHKVADTLEKALNNYTEQIEELRLIAGFDDVEENSRSSFSV